MTLFLNSALLAACLPCAALAQEVIGSINAAVDGTPKSWYVTQENGASQSFVMAMAQDLYEVTLWGNPTPDNNAQFNGALILDFIVLARGDSPKPMEPSLQWLEQGYLAGYLALDDHTLDVTLSKAEETTTGFSVAGTFHATAQFSDQIMLQMTDPTRTVAFDGNFAANVPLR